MSLEQNGAVKAGELLLLTEGQYSDYQVLALVKVLKDFEVNVLVAEFDKEQPGKVGEWGVDDFKIWLFAKGYIEDVAHREFHLGVRLDPKIWEKEE